MESDLSDPFFKILTMIFLLILDGGERQRKRERERDVRNIDLLPLVGSPTRNRTCNLLVYGTMVQPTELPSQGMSDFFVLLFLRMEHN